MSEMVERVARAICAKTNIAMDGVSEVVLDDPDFVVPAARLPGIKRDTPRWKFYIPQAIAAIEAMREPTKAMVDASESLVAADEIGRYVAMIDAALAT